MVQHECVQVSSKHNDNEWYIWELAAAATFNPPLGRGTEHLEFICYPIQLAVNNGFWKVSNLEPFLVYDPV